MKIIPLLDNWKRFKHNKQYLYHVSTIDKLDRIKKFGLNTVVAGLNRRGNANTEGVYLTTNVGAAFKGMEELEGIQVDKLILFAIRKKDVINNLYVDLEMTAINSFIKGDISIVNIEKKYPCKYKSDYNKYIDLLLSKNVFYTDDDIEYIECDDEEYEDDNEYEEYEDEYDEYDDKLIVDTNVIKELVRSLDQANCFYCTNSIPYSKLIFLGRLKVLDINADPLPTKLFVRQDYV